jgi:hypothetical protein
MIVPTPDRPGQAAENTRSHPNSCEHSLVVRVLAIPRNPPRHITVGHGIPEHGIEKGVFFRVRWERRQRGQGRKLDRRRRWLLGLPSQDGRGRRLLRCKARVGSLRRRLGLR